jgi:hypothetical protein
MTSSVGEGSTEVMVISAGRWNTREKRASSLGSIDRILLIGNADDIVSEI